jgi:hypothetical protein
MRLLSKELLIKHEEKRPVVSGFITYVSVDKPIMMHCYGWEDYSDGYDDYAVQLSADNGVTWSEPRIHWKSTVSPEGKIRFAEPAVFLDPDTRQFIVLTDKVLYPKDHMDVDAQYSLVMEVYDSVTGSWGPRRELEFPGQRCPAMSFSFPIKTAKGRLLFPGMRQVRDAEGKAIHYKKCWAPVDEMMTVIGEYKSNGEIAWRLGQSRPIDPEISSRGIDENTLFELRDGRIAAVCRGDNSMFPDKPGHKWLCFSSDQGETWSDPTPLPAADGSLPESGSNGAAIFRSIKNGKVYWIGNLCLEGQRANGNQPRSSLSLVEVQEEPFALKRETTFVIEEKNHNDSPEIQLSNFRFYQDRQTGDVVVYLVRLCERGMKEWWKSDYYRYRIELD